MVQPGASFVLLLISLLAGSGCGEPTAQEAQPQPRPPPSVETPSGTQEAARIVAIGDLHGDLDATLAVLRLAGLVDEAGRWSGGHAVLVQTGDQLDRGDQGVETLDLLQRLQLEAAQAGGRVEVLLGNHEVMNLTGDWRYVTPGDIAGYGGQQARQAALASEGEDGAWLRQRPVSVKVGRTVFAHGGITPAMAEQGLDRLNAWALAAVRGLASPEVLGREGPLWYRGYLEGDPLEVCPVLERALASLGASRMVVGHTTQRSGRIAERCGGALLGIDTGISAHYGQHIAALEIRGDDAWALYPSGMKDLVDP